MEVDVTMASAHARNKRIQDSCFATELNFRQNCSGARETAQAVQSFAVRQQCRTRIIRRRPRRITVPDSSGHLWFPLGYALKCSILCDWPRGKAMKLPRVLCSNEIYLALRAWQLFVIKTLACTEALSPVDVMRSLSTNRNISSGPEQSLSESSKRIPFVMGVMPFSRGGKHPWQKTGRFGKWQGSGFH